MTEITNDNEVEFLNTKGVSVEKYYGTWCGPCKMMDPIVDEISKEYPNVNFGKIDVDQNTELMMKYSIRSIPTLLYFKNGELVDRISGAHPKSVITTKLEQYLN
jgi:thioredoxin 1